MLDESIDHRLGVFARHPDQHHVTRMTLNECCDLAVVAARYQVAFPVARNGTVLNLGRALPDRDGVADPAVVFCLLRVMTRSTHRPGFPKTLYKLLFQGASGLDEQRFIDRLV